jgi:hypothetical protein
MFLSSAHLSCLMMSSARARRANSSSHLATCDIKEGVSEYVRTAYEGNMSTAACVCGNAISNCSMRNIYLLNKPWLKWCPYLYATVSGTRYVRSSQNISHFVLHSRQKLRNLLHDGPFRHASPATSLDHNMSLHSHRSG